MLSRSGCRKRLLESNAVFGGQSANGGIELVWEITLDALDQLNHLHHDICQHKINNILKLASFLQFINKNIIK
jgi:hypothetical protein